MEVSLLPFLLLLFLILQITDRQNLLTHTPPADAFVTVGEKVTAMHGKSTR